MRVEATLGFACVKKNNLCKSRHSSSVTTGEGGEGGDGPPWVTLSTGDTRFILILFVAKFRKSTR